MYRHILLQSQGSVSSVVFRLYPSGRLQPERCKFLSTPAVLRAVTKRFPKQINATAVSWRTAIQLTKAWFFISQICSTFNLGKQAKKNPPVMIRSLWTPQPCPVVFSVLEFSGAPQPPCAKGKRATGHNLLGRCHHDPHPSTQIWGTYLHPESSSLLLETLAPEGLGITWTTWWTVEKVVCLNKALWAQDKTSTDVFQTESILSPGFHNFRPNQILAQEGEELCAQHWAGRRKGASSRKPVPWERLAPIRPPHRTRTQASSQQAPAVDAKSSRGPMEAPLKMVTSRQKNQWITNSSSTQNKIS